MKYITSTLLVMAFMTSFTESQLQANLPDYNWRSFEMQMYLLKVADEGQAMSNQRAKDEEQIKQIENQLNLSPHHTRTHHRKFGEY